VASATRSLDPAKEYAHKADVIRETLFQRILDGSRLEIVKAPPGSGKTWLLVRAAELAFKNRQRVAIATQTNSQADEICDRLERDHPGVNAVRFVGAQHYLGNNWKRIAVTSKSGDLPSGPCVVVGTSAKWGAVEHINPFHLLFVEEAWQLGWADFMLLSPVSGRFVLIGDPGQIPPVVSVDASRWETSPRPPHWPAPEVILGSSIVEPLDLPATRRLPFDSAPLVQSFYDFDFGSFAGPRDRRLETRAEGRRSVDKVIDILRGSSVAAYSIPTPDAGPPLDADPELAIETVAFIRRLLRSDAKIVIDGKKTPLKSSDIGVVATRRAMNALIRRELDRSSLKTVDVDTAERWQGLERPVMIAVHPLSGVERPSSFDLTTGRLCVMASRHKVSVIVMTRDHVGEMLRSFIPAADQALGRDDVTGRGHNANLRFWQQLETRGLVVSA
jgi:hypothetical protein